VAGGFTGHKRTHEAHTRACGGGEAEPVSDKRRDTFGFTESEDDDDGAFGEAASRARPFRGGHGLALELHNEEGAAAGEAAGSNSRGCGGSCGEGSGSGGGGGVGGGGSSGGSYGHSHGGSGDGSGGFGGRGGSSGGSSGCSSGGSFGGSLGGGDYGGGGYGGGGYGGGRGSGRFGGRGGSSGGSSGGSGCSLGGDDYGGGGGGSREPPTPHRSIEEWKAELGMHGMSPPGDYELALEMQHQEERAAAGGGGGGGGDSDESPGALRAEDSGSEGSGMVVPSGSGGGGGAAGAGAGRGTPAKKARGGLPGAGAGRQWVPDDLKAGMSAPTELTSSVEWCEYKQQAKALLSGLGLDSSGSPGYTFKNSGRSARWAGQYQEMQCMVPACPHRYRWTVTDDDPGVAYFQSKFSHEHDITKDTRKRGMKAVDRGSLLQAGMFRNAQCNGKELHTALACAPGRQVPAPSRQMCQNVLNANRKQNESNMPASMAASTVTALRTMFDDLRLVHLRDSNKGSSVELGGTYNECTVGIIGNPEVGVRVCGVCVKCCLGFLRLTIPLPPMPDSQVSDDCKTVNFVLSSEFQLSHNIQGATQLGDLQKGSDFTHNTVSERLRTGTCGACSMNSHTKLTSLSFADEVRVRMHVETH
jgi:hypothetical protein